MKHLATLAASFCALALLAAPAAHASLVNNNDGTFTDTQTGYLWRTLGQYDGLNYAAAKALLPAGYHVASAAELGTLTAHAPAGPANFAALVAAMGANADNGMIWAFYGDGSNWLWDDGYAAQWATNAASNAYGWDNWNYAGDASYAQSGLSLFAVDTDVVVPGGQVPEPATSALLACGLLGLFGLRGRR